MILFVMGLPSASFHKCALLHLTRLAYVKHLFHAPFIVGPKNI